MDAKNIMWLTFLISILIVQSSCEQKKSLTFVIDSTRSMTDDISHVRQAAKSIMNIVLNGNSSKIEDIVLVIFRDPEVEFRKRTKDEAELKKALDDINLIGNYDCPEMCLSGIEMGLEESLPSSVLYVFTDASAKDHQKFETIKTLSQEKQIQVVFVLTGNCEDLGSPASQVYYNIAATSNGQVFVTDKDKVGEVLEYVKETIKGERTVLLSTVVHTNLNSDTYVDFNIDDQTEYALVSTSGPDVKLEVYKDSTLLPGEKVTWTKNAKVLKLIGITPGLYKAALRGSSTVNVMVFGRTDFNFKFGFSNSPQTSLNYTQTQPSAGYETHLIVSVKDDEHSVNIDNAEILDMDDKAIGRYHLTNVGNNIYRTDKFLPPNVMFKVVVTATSRNTGNPIRRIADTPVESIKPVLVKPEIDHTETYIEAKEDSEVKIHCRIQKAKPKPYVTWYFKKQDTDEFKLLPGKIGDVLLSTKISVSNMGEYQCMAENIAGHDKHVVQLEVIAKPKFEDAPTTIEEKENVPVTLKCELRKGNPRPGITWSFQASGSTTFTTLSNTGEELRLPAAQVKDSGAYKCVAENSAGQDERTMRLTVLTKPKFEDAPTSIEDKENLPVTLKCKLHKGNPSPGITWSFQASGSATFATLSNTGEELRLPAAQVKDSGAYKCVAENRAGHDDRTMRLTVLAKPKFDDAPTTIEEKESVPVTLKCELRKGNPRPGITWSFQASGSATSTTLSNTGEELRLPAAQVKDSGVYKCVAENSAGRDDRTMQLTVLAKPKFEDAPAAIEEKENVAVTLKCKLGRGNPRPGITWSFQASGSATFTTLSNTGEELRLPAAQVKDSGAYKCVAKNSAGHDQRTIRLTVLAKPKFEDAPAAIEEKENVAVTLKCKLGRGNPRPGITWSFQASGSATFTTLSNTGEELRLPAAQVKDSGAYKCVAKNSAGHDQRTIRLTVLAKPKFEDAPAAIEEKENVAVTLKCKLGRGNPRPGITWSFQASGSATFTTLSNTGEELRLPAAQVKDSGAYKCVAKNSAGHDERTIRLTVLAKPKFEDAPAAIEEKENVAVTLKCKLGRGNPRPGITWSFQASGSATFTTLSNTGEELRLPAAQVKDSGAYKCVAKNSAGHDQRTIRLTVLAKPKFEDAPAAIEEKENVAVTLKCKLGRGNPRPGITWSFQASGSATFTTLSNTGEELRLPAAQVKDSGAYKCVAKNSAGHDERTIRLTVLAKPKFEDAPAAIEEKENVAVTLKCKLGRGNPRPGITWSFQASGSATFTTLSNTGEELRLPAAQVKDSGAYKCVAKNSAGHDERTIRLTVLAKPKFEDAPAAIEEKENVAVTLKCKLGRGNPRPGITWSFQASGSATFTTLSNTGEELRLPAAQVKDSGAYKCVAKNSAGHDERTIRLTVLAKPKFEDAPAAIEEKENVAVTLKCKLGRGNPRPGITWSFQASGSATFTTLSNTGEELRLPAAQVKDSGAYKCVAKNSAGHDERTIRLTVLAKPKFENAPAAIEEKENVAVTLKCKLGRGNPRPGITWSFQASGSATFTTLSNTGEKLRLPAAQVKDSGAYKCVAKNSAGHDQRTIRLTVLAKPKFKDAPASIEEKENVAVTLKCKLGRGNPRPGITWSFQASSSAAFTTLSNTGEELRLPAVQVKDSGVYRCVARNSAGHDDRTMRLTVLAVPAIENSAPSIIKVKEHTTVSIPCRLSKGFPTPTITWWYLDPHSTKYAIIPDANADLLHLEYIALSKAGHYQCVAYNILGQAVKDVQVIVEAPAKIVFIPPNSPFYLGVEGDYVMRLPCTAVGFPKPSVSWIVDQVVVGKDKSKSLYVEDDVLYLKNPQRFDSSNNSTHIFHTYVCRAMNDFDEDHQKYEVIVSEYADYETNNTDKKYAEIKKPYDLICSLPYTDPNSVRWFYNSIPMNKTGPSLHFDEPTEVNNGNYTCRVSDLNGAASKTVKLDIIYPPSASRLAYDYEWNGEVDEVTCKTDTRYAKYELFYQDKKIKEAEADQLGLNPIGWGQYICRVSNPVGTLNITYNVYAEDCIIYNSKVKNMPLLLDMSFDWPSISKNWERQVISNLEELTLVCEDGPHKTLSYSQSANNSFVKFPGKKTIVATCDHEDTFIVDGVSYKFSDLDCKNEVTASVVPSHKCMGSNTMMMRVGFNVNGFLDVYKSCMNTKKNVVLYTELITMGVDLELENTQKPQEPCETVGDCCYESVQLVKAADVSSGPAEKATLRKSLNSVSYCKPKDENTTSWHDIDMQVRRQLTQYRLMIWSGAVQYTTVGKLLVPQYLWKVVKDLQNDEILGVIVHSNKQAPKFNVCANVCHETTWFESFGPRTYCCRLEEFKKAFNLSINF